MLELFLAISASLEAIFLLFMLSVSATQSLSVSIVFLHSVVCDFWVGCRVEIFGFRSMLLYPILRDTCLTNGFIGVFRFHRRSSRLHLLPTYRSVTRTRKGVCLPFLHVVTTHPPPTFPCPGFRWLPVVPATPAGERPSSSGAWKSTPS
jgi:hypothetical protein